MGSQSIEERVGSKWGVGQWQFTPTPLNGVAVEVGMKVNVYFDGQ